MVKKSYTVRWLDAEYNLAGAYEVIGSGKYVSYKIYGKGA